MSHWILGDPTSRRVADYREAAASCGQSAPQCVDWCDVISQGSVALDAIPTGSRLRIDSFGQRDETIAALIRYGGGTEFPQRGEIRSLPFQYAGICNVLRDVTDWSSHCVGIEMDQSPADVQVMFDKWETHQRLTPYRPRTILLSININEFNEQLIHFAKTCNGRVFVKPRFASSASGVCCYRVAGDRQQLIAPIEIVREATHVRLFNSLRVRSFTSHGDIQDIFGVLAVQGMIAEVAVNKARVDGERFDLRYVVIGGQANHVVVRQSASPITNLHLGNRRGSLAAVTETVRANRLNECRQLAIEAASCFPKTLTCGVDILLPRSGEPVVCEVNAFGDFLPGLIAGGKTVFQAIVNAGTHARESSV